VWFSRSRRRWLVELLYYFVISLVFVCPPSVALGLAQAERLDSPIDRLGVTVALLLPTFL
jgi:hypothetical protein